MTVIAMTREMGTLGKDVAAGLAEAQGIEVIHHELVEHFLAERLQLGESTVHRFLEGHSSLWDRWKIDSNRMSRYTATEVLQLAKRGNVLIRGWGAAQLLRKVPHVLCVRICAPMSKRISVMMERLGVTDEKAVLHEIERSDDAHSHALQRQFLDDWREPVNYDIVLNTGFVPIENCISILQQLSASADYRETDDSRRILADKLVEAEIRIVLDDNPTDTPFGRGINVAVKNGIVQLSGVVGVHSQISNVIDQIQGIDGVEKVENNIVFARVNSGE